MQSWSGVAPDFQVAGSVKGHHLFVYDEPSRAEWFAQVTAALDAAQPAMPLSSYLCPAKKGAAVRAIYRGDEDDADPAWFEATIAGARV